MTFSAVILAGGQSSRMGQDKAKMLRPDGLTQLEFTQQQIAALAPDLIMISGSKDLPDIFNGLGPLAGIHAALETLNVGDTLLVVPCDQPLLTPQTLALLLSNSQSTAYRDSFLPCYLQVTLVLKQHLDALLNEATSSYPEDSTSSKNSKLSIKSLLNFCNVHWQDNTDRNSTLSTNTKNDWDEIFSIKK